MAILTIILTVFFVIVAILLILSVLIQSEDGSSLGGMFAGSSNSTFGAQSGNVLTRITYVLGALFLVSAFSIALITKSPSAPNIKITPSTSLENTTSDPALTDVKSDATSSDTLVPAEESVAPATETTDTNTVPVTP